MSQQERAFVDLISQHQGIIHKVCRLYCEDLHARKDLFQEILYQLWRSFGNYKGKAKITTWMYRIALNTAISGIRKKSRQIASTNLKAYMAQIPEAGKDEETAEKRIFLYKAINQLSNIEKAIVMLHLEENNYEEIATIVGITPNHVGVKLNRIKGKLKKLVDKHYV